MSIARTLASGASHREEELSDDVLAAIEGDFLKWHWRIASGAPKARPQITRYSVEHIHGAQPETRFRFICSGVGLLALVGFGVALVANH